MNIHTSRTLWFQGLFSLKSMNTLIRNKKVLFLFVTKKKNKEKTGKIQTRSELNNNKHDNNTNVFKIVRNVLASDTKYFIYDKMMTDGASDDDSLFGCCCWCCYVWCCIVESAKTIRARAMK